MNIIVPQQEIITEISIVEQQTEETLLPPLPSMLEYQTEESLVPPLPPPLESPIQNILHPSETEIVSNVFQRGNFDYIKCDRSKIMIETAYRAVSLLELWDYMKKDTETYMFSSDEEINRIYNKIVELGYDGHSGFSFGYTLRNIQKIAQIGEEAYMNWYINN